MVVSGVVMVFSGFQWLLFGFSLFLVFFGSVWLFCVFVELVFVLLRFVVGFLFIFPNETSFWETPLRIKEIAGDRWEKLISGPNPAADFTSVCVRCFFPWCVFPEKHTISRQHPGS